MSGIEMLVIGFVIGAIADELRDRMKLRAARRRCRAGIAAFDAIVRHNDGPDYDAIGHVGWDEDGIYGALDGVHSSFAEVHGRQPNDVEADLLHDLFEDELQPVYRDEWRTRNPGLTEPGPDYDYFAKEA